MHDASESSRSPTLAEISRQLVSDEISDSLLETSRAYYTNTSTNKRSSKDKDSDKKGKKKKCQSCNKTGCTCLWCNKIGHHVKDCRAKAAGTPQVEKKQQGGDNKEDKEKEEKKDPLPKTFMAITTQDRPTSDWILDSGCTDHLIKEREAFIDMQYKNTRVQIGDGSHSAFFARGVGTVEFQTVVHNQIQTIRLRNAFWAPDAHSSLVSETTLLLKGAKIETSSRGAKVIVNGEVVMIAPLKERLFKLNVKLPSPNERPYAFITRQDSEKQSMELWHRRLGHVGTKTIQKTAETASGILLSNSDAIKDCIPCHTGKVPRESFPESGHIATRSLDVVVCDLAGPMEVPTSKGAKYFVVLRDLYSMYTKVYLLSKKEDFMTVVKEYVELTERVLDLKIVYLRSDNDSVLCSTENDAWFKTRGIQRQKTVPYTPQQNGTAERAIRSIKEMANTLLQDAQIYMGMDLHASLWGEACLTAAYIYNRTYKYNLNATLYEKLFKHKPAVGHLKAFGCPAYTFVHKDNRDGPFDSHKELKIFVGYPDNVKGWKFYDPSTSKFSVAESVLFLENNVMEENNKKGSTLEGESTSKASVMELPEFFQIQDTDNIQETINNIMPIEKQPIQGTDDIQDSMSIKNVVRKVKKDRPEPTRLQPSRTQRPRDEWEGNLFFALAKVRNTGWPQTYDEALSSEHSDKWLEAIDTEMKSIIDNNTFELTDLPQGRKAIGVRWVLSVKPAVGETPERYKARLVGQGFSQIAGIDYQDTYAPTSRVAAIRTFFAVVASQGLSMLQIDAVTAFLNSNLNEEIYLRQPAGFIDKARPQAVWRLKKALYGLKQAPLLWYETLKTAILGLGFVIVSSEACVFRNNDRNLLLIIYVDDMIIAGRDEAAMKTFHESLAQHFKLKLFETPKKFLGFEISRDWESKTITLTQQKYIEGVLSKFNMSGCKESATPMQSTCRLRLLDTEQAFDATIYQAAIGCLNYAYVTTRLDIGYALSVVASFSNDPSQEHWMAVKRILRYLQKTKHVGLVVGGDKLILKGFYDASFADRHDAKSSGGHIFFLGKGPISWSAKAQSLVTLSTAEAEYVQATEATKEAMWLKELLGSFRIDTGKVPLLGDNRSAMALAGSEKFLPRTKHINVRYHFVREAISNGIIDLKWVSSEDNIADIFTKPLAVGPFQRLAALANITIPDRVYVENQIEDSTISSDTSDIEGEC